MAGQYRAEVDFESPSPTGRAARGNGFRDRHRGPQPWRGRRSPWRRRMGLPTPSGLAAILTEVQVADPVDAHQVSGRTDGAFPGPGSGSCPAVDLIDSRSPG